MGPGAFLNLLWGPTPAGLIQIWELDGKRSSYYRSPAGTAGLANRVDVYTAVSLAHKDHGRSRRARADQAIAIPGLWLDIDINGGPTNKTGAAPDRETAKQVAYSYAFPTILVDSGYGLHAWYLFKEPWLFTSTDDQAQAALAAAQWFALHRQAAQTLGFGIDHAHDLARLMRLPGTYNGKGKAAGEDLLLPGRPVIGQLMSPSFPRETLLEIAAQAGDVPVGANHQTTLDGTPVEVTVGPAAGATGIKVEALIDNIPEFAAAWRHQLGPRAGHWTLSEYDLSLCGQAAQAGFTDQELADLIRLHRFAHDDQSRKADRLDYLRRTIRLVRARGQRDEAADTLEQLRRAA